MLIQDYLFQIKVLSKENHQKTREIKDLSMTLLQLEESQSSSQNRLEELEFHLDLETRRHNNDEAMNQEKIQRLEDQNKRLIDDLTEIQERLLANGREMRELIDENKEMSIEMKDLERKLENYKIETFVLKDRESEIMRINDSLKEEIRDFNERLMDYERIEGNYKGNEGKLREALNVNIEITNENREIKERFDEKSEEIAKNRLIIKVLEEKIERYERLFCEYNLELIEKDDEIKRKSVKPIETNENIMDFMGLKDQIADFKEILAIKDQEINKLTHNLHNKVNEIEGIQSEMENLLIYLQSGDFKALMSLETKNTKNTEIRIVLAGIVKEKAKFERFYTKTKEKIKDYREKNRRFSMEEQKKREFFNNNERVKTEPMEMEIRNLQEKLGYLEDLLGLNK